MRDLISRLSELTEVKALDAGVTLSQWAAFQITASADLAKVQKKKWKGKGVMHGPMEMTSLHDFAGGHMFSFSYKIIAPDASVGKGDPFFKKITKTLLVDTEKVLTDTSRKFRSKEFSYKLRTDDSLYFGVDRKSVV